MAAEVKKEIQLEIAHVLFTDIVGYSKLPIHQQRALVERLNEIVRGTDEYQAAEKAGRLIKIPTGDGITLVFYDSPETPAECALEISRALKRHPELQLRMGIHSGPVSGIIDATGKANVAGAGINIAQRVMDCGDAGHILLSKHVAEDLEEYPHWQPHLHELGECEVKHGARVSVVNLYTGELGNPAVPGKLKAARVAAAARRKRAAFRWLSLGVMSLLAAVAVIGFLLFRYRRPPGTAELPFPEKSIAVLPFENRSEDKANAYFADGIHDEILTRLSKIADLKVISRTSTQHYKSAPENLPEIAKQLGVAHIVEGSVQKSADSVRVNVQLIKAANDSHLWADTFDRKLTDIFSVESEVAKAIADQLRAKLTGQEEQVIATKPTQNADAYVFYLRANQISRNPDTLLEDYKTAEQLYVQAIELDPNFALAYAQLASVYAAIFHYYEPTDSWKTKAGAKAETALRLQPNLAEAHFALGQYSYWVDQDYDRALEQFEIASRLSPSNGEIPRFIAAIRRRQGKWQEALEAYERVARLDPQNPNTVRELLQTDTAMRRWKGAARWAQRWRTLAPDSLVAKIQSGYVDFWWKGDTRLLKSVVGQIPAGVDPDGVITACRWELAMLQRDYSAAKKVLGTSAVNELSYTTAGFTPKIFFEGCIYLAQNDKVNAQKTFEAARPAFEAALKEAPANADRHAILGWLYAFMGRRDDAIREGRRAVELKPESKDAVDGAIMSCYLALIYARVRENDLAIPLIERLLKTPGAVDSVDYSITINDLKYRWEWDPLRSDPAFQKLVASESPKPTDK